MPKNPDPPVPTGKVVEFSNGFPGNGLLDEQAMNGWDLVGVEAVGSSTRFSFTRYAADEPSNWIYRMSGEIGLDADSQQMTLNAKSGAVTGWELVAVALERDRYMLYFCRLPYRSSSHLRRWWETRVVERPITGMLELLKSLAPLKREGWTYRDHAVVPRDGGHLYLVYLQKPSRNPDIRPH